MSKSEKNEMEESSENEEKNSLVNNSRKSNEIKIKPEETCNEVINEFLKIKNCSILEYGVSPSKEKIKFGYCRSCEFNESYLLTLPL